MLDDSEEDKKESEKQSLRIKTFPKPMTLRSVGEKLFSDNFDRYSLSKVTRLAD